jgi:hypothetical protein
MRSTAGVRLDEEGSPVDVCVVRFDLFGDCFIEQSGDTVALPLAFQKQLVDALLENIDQHESKPRRSLSKPLLSMGMMMSLMLVYTSPHLHCWRAKHPVHLTQLEATRDT